MESYSEKVLDNDYVGFDLCYFKEQPNDCSAFFC